MLDWLKQHPGLAVSVGLSVALLIAGILVAPIAVGRLPEDFFTRKDRKPSLWLNIAGWALIVAGIAMLILPGPGAVALLAGIVLADFPGKRRFLTWLLSQGRIFEGSTASGRSAASRRCKSRKRAELRMWVGGGVGRHRGHRQAKMAPMIAP